MGKEIERKFLIKGEIPRKNIKEKLIKQGYIFIEKGKHLRIRLYMGKAILGLKFTKGIFRDEFETLLSLKDGKEIYNKCEHTVEKYRTTFKIGKNTYDIDRYPNGITVVEVEFQSESDAKKWKKPEWIGKEISGNRDYSNLRLASQNLKFK